MDISLALTQQFFFWPFVSKLRFKSTLRYPVLVWSGHVICQAIWIPAEYWNKMEILGIIAWNNLAIAAQLSQFFSDEGLVCVLSDKFHSSVNGAKQTWKKCLVWPHLWTSSTKTSNPYTHRTSMRHASKSETPHRKHGMFQPAGNTDSQDCSKPACMRWTIQATYLKW